MLQEILNDYTDNFDDMNGVYPGNATDKKIYERLTATWKQAVLIEDNLLLDSFNKAVDRDDIAVVA